MTISGYQPIQQMRLIARTLERELNLINPARLFTCRTVDVDYDDFVSNTGWSRNGKTNGGIVYVTVPPGGEKFDPKTQPGAINTYTDHLVTTSIPIYGQRANEDAILDPFVELVMSKIVEVGSCNQSWIDENGNALSWDCNVTNGGRKNSKTKDNTPLFTFEHHFIVSNTFVWSAN